MRFARHKYARPNAQHCSRSASVGAAIVGVVIVCRLIAVHEVATLILQIVDELLVVLVWDAEGKWIGMGGLRDESEGRGTSDNSSRSTHDIEKLLCVRNDAIQTARQCVGIT